MNKGLGLKGWARKAGAWVCVAMAACAVLGCSGCGQSAEQVRETLQGGIETEMGQLANLTTETSTELFASDFTNELVAAGVDPVTVYGPMFANLSYEVGDVQVDGDTAHIALQVTNKDMTAVMQNYTAMMVNELSTQAGRDALAALDQAALTRHLAEVLVQCLQDTNVPLSTADLDLVYVKEGSTWRLEDSTALTSALLGGLDTISAGDTDDALLQATAAAADANLAALLPPVEPVADPAVEQPVDQPVEGAAPEGE